MLHRPTVVGDSLWGEPEAGREPTIRLALRDVQSVAVSRFDAGKTLVLAFAAVLAAGVIACAGGGCGFVPLGSSK
jgi:hypothetical protein